MLNLDNDNITGISHGTLKENKAGSTTTGTDCKGKGEAFLSGSKFNGGTRYGRVGNGSGSRKGRGYGRRLLYLAPGNHKSPELLRVCQRDYVKININTDHRKHIPQYRQ